MAELVRRGPLEGVRPIVHADTTVTVAPPLARTIVRGASATTPCRAVSEGERAALWLGPDEWLVIGATLGAMDGVVIDVGHRQIALLIEGPRAATLLSGACPLDLHPSAFPVGMCTRTVFAKAEIVLWRQAEHRFHLEVARSFAAYVYELLREIAAGTP
jgi:sarcosine oxidase subunit gamma